MAEDPQGFADYSGDMVSIIFAKVPLQGKGDGPFFRCRYLSPQFTDKVGSAGLVSRSRTMDMRADIEIILETTSSSNAILSAIIASDLALRNGAGIGSLLVQDRSGFSIYTSEKNWVMQYPDREYARETGQNVWRLRAAKLITVEAGN